MENKPTGNPEQTSQRSESADVLVKQYPSSYRRSQHHIPTGKSDTYLIPIPSSDSPEAVSVTTAYFHEIPELKIYSRAILYCIVHGNNDASENRLLRELYWHTVEKLAHLEK